MVYSSGCICGLFFFFNDTATTEIYTLPYTTLFRSRLVVSGSGTRTVRLYNANGQLVRQISTRGEQAVVSLRGMPKGAYLLRLEGKRNGCWRILWDGR